MVQFGLQSIHQVDSEVHNLVVPKGREPYPSTCMAVASGQAGSVLVRLVFATQFSRLHVCRQSITK